MRNLGGESANTGRAQIAFAQQAIVARPYDFVKTLSPEGCDGRRRPTTAPVAVTSRAVRGTPGAAATLRSVAAPLQRESRGGDG